MAWHPTLLKNRHLTQSTRDQLLLLLIQPLGTPDVFDYLEHSLFAFLVQVLRAQGDPLYPCLAERRRQFQILLERL